MDKVHQNIISQSSNDWLNIDEEHELISRVQQSNDSAAINKLVTSQCKYVLKVARKNLRNTISLDDLFNQGIIGLLEAIKAFDLTKKVRLSTYANFYIKKEIIGFVSQNQYQVKLVTSPIINQIRIQSSKSKPGISLDDEAEMIAMNVNMDKAMVKRALKRFRTGFVSIDEHVVGDNFGEAEGLYRADGAPVNDELIDKSLRHQWLIENLNVLDAKEKTVIRLRYLGDDVVTYKEVSLIMGDITPQGVEVIAKRAIGKLKSKINQSDNLEAVYA